LWGARAATIEDATNGIPANVETIRAVEEAPVVAADDQPVS
jgi:hypothetical protein